MIFINEVFSDGSIQARIVCKKLKIDAGKIYRYRQYNQDDVKYFMGGLHLRAVAI